MFSRPIIVYPRRHFARNVVNRRLETAFRQPYPVSVELGSSMGIPLASMSNRQLKTQAPQGTSMPLTSYQVGFLGNAGARRHPLAVLKTIARFKVSNLWAGYRGFTTDEEPRVSGARTGKEIHEKEKEIDLDPSGHPSVNAKDERESGGPEEDEVASLRESLAVADEMLKEARQKAQYLAAEMENVRAIARRDAEEARLYALHKFSKQLLDVADNLERALEAVREGEVRSVSLDKLLEGVEMTSDQLQKVFKSQGLEKYGASGEKFDPNLHDAMFEYEDPCKEPGTLGQVLKYGYKLHDRVIRAAQVGIVKVS